MLPAGEKRAIELIRAHRLWERYLAEKKAWRWMRCTTKPSAASNHLAPTRPTGWTPSWAIPKFDPHGDPIPPRDGSLGHAEGVPLSRWPEHRLGRVIHVEDEPPALFTQLRCWASRPAPGRSG